jgi:hypothetical protein
MPVPLVTWVPRLLPCRDVRPPEPDQVAALVRITADLGAGPAAHPLFKLPDWCLPRPPQRREVDGTVRVAAGAFDLEIPEAGIQGVPNGRGGLCRSAVAFHAVVPSIAGRDIGSEPRLPGAPFRMPDRLTPLALFGGSAHGVENAPLWPMAASGHRLRLAGGTTLMRRVPLLQIAIDFIGHRTLLDRAH